MLKVDYSLKLEFLVKDFVNTVLNPVIWDNPFNPPLVIFPDSKVEQWFKLHIISEKEKYNNNSVLMNLNTVLLEGFLFETIANGIAEKDDEKIWYERLSVEVLQTHILNKLISKCENGKLYYETFKTRDIANYIEDSEAKINQNNLYDFSKNLAQLFTEYMDSRNDDLEKGIHSKWSKGENYFDGSSMEEWQKSIYKDLLCDNPLTLSTEDDDSYVVKYVTLAQLVEINKKSNGGKLKFQNLNKNIFLFGFISLGQFYRTLLGEIAKETNLYVFLQSGDVDSKESNNSLYAKWNKTGSDSFKLWQLLADGGCTKVEQNDSCTKNLLTEIQNQIACDKKDSAAIKQYLEAKDDSISIIGAPSKLKEIEALHTSICSIINQNKLSKTPVNYSDFIVLAPNIQEYKIPVMQIFDQIEKDSTKNFPYIPYVFSDFSGEHSAVEEALSIFVSILKKDALYRTDLFTLFRNPVIKKARNYSEEEISAWSTWVTNLNGFRSSEARPDEWQILKNRLLVSILTEDSFKDRDRVLLPYSDMESQDSNCLYKFVDAIDQLENWRNIYAHKSELNQDDIIYIQNFLAYWFTLPSEQNDIFSGEKLVFSSIKNEIRNQRLLLNAGFETINADSFFMALKQNATGAKGNGSNLYVGGITFSNLPQNRALPAKYVYILGLSSKVFPGTDSELSIDLRKKMDAKTGDSLNSDRNKVSFLCHFMAAKEKICISFVNKDLMKDEDFFHSSVLDDLFEFMGVKKNFIKEITIDEVRNWNELFTQRSFRNKTNFSDVTKTKAQPDSYNNGLGIDNSENREMPARVSISAMKAFLKCPFTFYAGQVFDLREDEEGENESTLYEPLTLDYLTTSSICTQIMMQVLENPNLNVTNIVNEKITDLENKQILRDNIFGNVEKQNLADIITCIVRSLKNNISMQFVDFKFNEKLDLSVPLQFEGQNRNWELSGDLCAYSFDQSNNKLKVLDVMITEELKIKNILKSYLCAVALIAQKAEPGKPIEVELIIIGGGDELKTIPLHQSITKEKAFEILNKLYEGMYITPFKKMILLHKTRTEPIKTDYVSFSKYINDACNNSEWKYFSKKEFFNPYVHFGFDRKDFEKIPDSSGAASALTGYAKAVKKWKEFVPGLIQEV